MVEFEKIMSFFECLSDHSYGCKNNLILIINFGRSKFDLMVKKYFHPQFSFADDYKLKYEQ